MNTVNSATVTRWAPGRRAPAFTPQALLEAVHHVRAPLHVLRDPNTQAIGVGLGGTLHPATGGPAQTWPVVGALPPLYPEWLGDRGFCEQHRLRFPYVAGAMANGIHTPEMTIAMARAGMLGFFGAAGLPLERVERALEQIEAAVGRPGAGGPSWGSNLIHSPNEPELEAAVVALYLRRGVRRVSASAFMALTPSVVRYAATGLHEGPQGQVLRRNHVFAKISRPEVARRFLSPPPAELLDGLVAGGLLQREEARLAARVPVAQDLIVEADSGGHTDNQSLTALFEVIAGLRDERADALGGPPARLGAAGGLGTPTAVAAAFALGAAFVVTGSVNQGAVESGLSPVGKQLLAQAGLADVMMAPAADMFELGVKVQVLKRGTLFGVRAAKLYAIYGRYSSLDALPEGVRAELEGRLLGRPLDAIWSDCERYFARRDPRQLERARREPKHKMALVFRWYLGQASRWAIQGADDRRMDYQIWCGPAMGAFNAWTRGSFMEAPERRGVVPIALNLLEGAAVITRAHQLRSFGAAVPAAAFRFAPRPLT